VGHNGSGKTTLLKITALLARLPAARFRSLRALPHSPPAM